MTSDPTLYTPSAVTSELLRYGGKNPYGLPNWRLIQAERHTVIRGGTWTDVDENDNALLVDASGNEIPRPPTVTKTVTGIREVPLYPVKGWILEQWFPASEFGGRDQWEANKDQKTGLAVMGPYPSEGGYWMMRGPWKQMPPVKYLRELIERYEWNMNKRDGVKPEAAMQNFLDEQKAIEDREMEHFTEEREYAMRHIVLPMMRSTSLSASRYRQRVMQQCGIRSHVSVGGDS